MQARSRRSWLSDAAIIAAVALLPLLFWWQLWALDPADRAVIAEGDFTSQYYPLQQFAARELAAGRFPAWDPFINAGQPGLADPQTGAGYPPNLLVGGILAVLGRSFTLGCLYFQVILHFSMAGVFTYLFVRRLARRSGARLPAARFAGAVASLSFTYAGYLTSFPVQQLTILQTAVWLPLILFFLDRAAHPPAAVQPGYRMHRSLILAGVALACSLLAGHPQTAMYVVYAVLAYGLFLAWPRDKRQASASKHAVLLHRASLVLLPVLAGVALAAVQLLPTLGFIARSTRAGLDYDSVSWGFPLAEFTHLLYPGYFGGSPQYLGILSPILAVLAVCLWPARREVRFWLGLGLAAFLLAFGGNLFLYSAAYLLAPGFGAVRNQERIIYLFSFAASVLAGYGALALVQPLPRPLRRALERLARGVSRVLVVALALTALWYYGFESALQQNVAINMFEGVLRHHALLLLVLGGAVLLLTVRRTGHVPRGRLMALTTALIGLNLFTVNWRYNLAKPALSGAFPETGLVRFLQQQPGVFRISSAGLLPGGANAGIVYGLEDITANTPLRLDSFQEFEDGVESWRRWQLLNVHYVVSDRDLEGPGLERVYEEGTLKVYRLGDPLPRAWVAHSGILAGDEEALAALNSDSFDPRSTVVLPLGSPAPGLSGAGPGEPAQVLRATPGRLDLRVASQTDGLLVVSQPYYPGWQARVDGRRTPIYRVNYMLQGIALSAGPHQVELTYHASVWPGIASLVALLACVAGLVVRRSAGRS